MRVSEGANIFRARSIGKNLSSCSSSTLGLHRFHLCYNAIRHIPRMQYWYILVSMIHERILIS
jgi:hypothetical protein